jgi:uncharacterized protein with GYD domain
VPKYLIQVAYTAEAWAAQTKNPRNVTERVGAAITQLGGRIESCYYAFGDADIIAILELPDNEAAAAFAIAVSAGGALRSVKTTALMSVDEGMSAMRKAASAGYQPPS